MKPAYCTNVLAGTSLAQTRSNVERVFGAVRTIVSPAAPLPIGLWLSARAAHQLTQEPGGVQQLRDWLGERGLVVTTLNAFPYNDFHGAVVKHLVYEPNWADARRLLYTTHLADLLPDLLPPGATRASISTVPVGWRARFGVGASGAGMGLVSAHMEQLVRHLARVEERSGVRVHVDMEPEPGCVLDRARDVTNLFEQVLSARRGEPEARRYVGVCHDVCHAAVMFEPQRDVLAEYRRAGIRVGKVQLSSAPACSGASDELAVLASFAEPRYLHQTCVRSQGEVRFFEDLPQALAAAPAGEWRTHFHVPIFSDRLGALGTTQSEICECLRVLAAWPADEQPQIEVETYAWDVLPADAAGERTEAGLVRGIASELRWAELRMAEARAAIPGAHA